MTAWMKTSILAVLSCCMIGTSTIRTATIAFFLACWFYMSGGLNAAPQISESRFERVVDTVTQNRSDIEVLRTRIEQNSVEIHALAASNIRLTAALDQYAGMGRMLGLLGIILIAVNVIQLASRLIQGKKVDVKP